MAHPRSTHVLAGLVLASTAVPARLGAQLTWRQAGAQLPARAGHFAFFDQPRGRVAVFAGQVTPTTHGNDCWELEGNEWMQVPVPALTARGHGAYCEDPSVPGNGILFGGRLDTGSLIGETLRFDVQALRFTVLAPATSPPPRWISAMAFDSVRGRAVLFGGGDAVGPLGDTWEWDGRDWQRLRPSQSPSPRANHAMAYDAARRRVVLYGGHSGQSLGDTWTFDGRTWTDVSPGRSPGSLHNVMLSYDENRRAVVLFGGKDDSGTVQDATWEWDGTSWRGPTLPATRPPARELASLTYDKQRRRLVLIGGQGQGGTLLGDAWTWDGTTWTQLLPNGREALIEPPGRTFPVLAYREAGHKIMLFGGYGRQGNQNVPLTDIWESDGNAWQQRTPLSSPPPAYRGAGATLRSTGDLFYLPGTDILGNPYNQLWYWNAWQWTSIGLSGPPVPSLRHQVVGSLQSSFYGWLLVRLVTSGTSPFLQNTLQIIQPFSGNVAAITVPGGPTPRTGSVMAQSQAAAVASDKVWLFGGAAPGINGTIYYNDVWELSDAGGGNFAWTQLAASGGSGPAPRANAGVCYDRMTHGLVVTGGTNGAVLGDTWTFSLSSRQWTQHTGVMPSPREGAAMTAMAGPFDTTSTLLFGGTSDGIDRPNDCWSFYALYTGWNRFVPYSRPEADGSSLVYDRHNRRCILFGGLAGGRELLPSIPPLWSYDGTSWLPLVASGRETPTTRFEHSAAFDEAHGAMIVFGGQDNVQSTRDTWALSSQGSWSRCATSGPPGSDGAAMVYVASQGRCLLVGGQFGGQVFGDTWAFDLSTNRWSMVAATPFVGRWHAMAYDRLRDRVVLFGGSATSFLPFLDETWEYAAGTGWRQLTPAHRPPGRMRPAMVYEETRGRVVMYGGRGNAGELGDVWEWDGSDWTPRTAETISPGVGRTISGFAYDSDRSRMVIHRGSVSHELNAPIDVTGRGNTVSPEGLRYWSQPVLGQTLRLGFGNPQGLALLGLGFGPIQQPLLQLGAPLCETSNLYALTLFNAVAAGSEPNVALGLPSDPSLRGLVLVMQGLSYQAAGCHRATDALNVRFD